MGWNWAHLNDLLLDKTRNRLDAVILCEENELKDSVGWGDELTGSFFVSLAYDMVIGLLDRVEAAKWNNIWKLKVPNRICSFLWLVRHGKILTNSNKKRRGISDEDMCWFC